MSKFKEELKKEVFDLIMDKQFNDIKERVLDPEHKCKDFMDVIEYGLISSQELKRGDDEVMYRGLLDAELKLENNEEFVKLGRKMQDVRMQAVESAGISALSDIGKNPDFRKYADEQNKLREQLVKVTQPAPAVQSMLESIAKANVVLKEHQQIWNDKLVFHQTEADRLQKEIDELDAHQENAMVVEVKKSEMEVAYADLKLASIFVNNFDSDFVSDIYREIEKDEKQNKYIKRNKTKEAIADGSGVSYKYRQKCLKVYEKYIQLQAQGKSKPVAKRMITNMKKFNKPTPKTLKTWLIQGKKASKNQPLLPSNK